MAVAIKAATISLAVAPEMTANPETGEQHRETTAALEVIPETTQVPQAAAINRKATPEMTTISQETRQSLQMAERALLSPDELKSLPKGDFVVMKTGTHPMRTKLQLYFKWGIKFEEPYQTPERAQREVYYAGKEELLMNIKRKSMTQMRPPAVPKADDYMSSYAEK